MTRRSTKRGLNSPYRRKKTAAPVPQENVEETLEVEESAQEKPSLEPGQMAQLIVDMRNGVVDQQAANALSEPLNDLAKAFAMQAEILRGVHETQVELSKTIKNDSKAEMMVNATDSLNSTFKGVKSVQQKLLDELEDRGTKSKSIAIWAVAVCVVVLFAFAGLFFWNNDQSEKRSDGLRNELKADFANRLDALYEEGVANNDSAEKWQSVVDQARKDLRQVETERNAFKMQIDILNESLKKANNLSSAEGQELARLRGEVMSQKPELDRLAAKVKDLENQLTDSLQRLEASRKEADHLRMNVIAKLNRVGAERMAETTENDNSKKRIIEQGEATAALLKDGAEGGTSSAPSISNEKALDDLNGLMSNHRGSRKYRIESIGKVGKHHLEDVVLTESAPGRGLIKKVRAKKLDIAISGRGDIVEFNFKNGEVQQKRTGGAMGPWTRFYNGRYRLTIYCLNGEKWMARNYGFFVVD